MYATNNSGVAENRIRIFTHSGTSETHDSDSGTKYMHQIHLPVIFTQTNEQVERFGDTLKRLLIEVQGEITSQQLIHTFVLPYRLTSNHAASTQKFTAQLFPSHQMRVVL